MRIVAPVAVALTSLGLLLGCAGASASSGGSHPGGIAVGDVERGRATYYGDSLAGNKTASGERYDPGLLTAAHRRLPFGTIVDVVRPDGRHVEVRINDRGPFGHEDRIIDLSRRAAEQLGMIREGVVDVEVRTLREPARKNEAAKR